MKAYGLPRNDDCEHPDVADCLLYGLKSSFHKIKSKNKRASRRIWKKFARRYGKTQCKEM
jgi:hypothetical protein